MNEDIRGLAVPDNEDPNYPAHSWDASAYGGAPPPGEGAAMAQFV